MKKVLLIGMALLATNVMLSQSWNPNGDNDTTGKIIAKNPNNPEAVNMLSWNNDIARIRIGGSGTGAINGFVFQGPSDVNLLRIYNNGNVNFYGNQITQTITGTPSNWFYLMQSNGKNSGFWANSGNPALYLRNTAGSLNTVIRPDGNSYFLGGDVGIGTNSPAARLHVSGNGIRADRYALTSITDLKYDSPWYGLGRGTFTDLSNDDTKSAVQLSGYYGLLLQTASGQVGIHENGNVGIGTSNPSAKLDVNGNIKATDFLTINKSGSYRIALNGQSSGYIYGRNDAAEHKFLIHSSGISYFNGGNVGIGTTNPDSKLTVKGKIHAEEVKIDLSVPAPDYVFTKDYDLLTIEKVQQHIAEKGHLPNIPSAKELEANGVELGMMNMKLLEKIEELTLYTIEQENKIKELEKQKEINQELKERLHKLEQIILKK